MYWTNICDFSRVIQTFCNVLMNCREFFKETAKSFKMDWKQPHVLTGGITDRHGKAHVIMVQHQIGTNLGSYHCSLPRRTFKHAYISYRQTNKDSLWRDISFALFPTTEATWWLTKAGSHSKYLRTSDLLSGNSKEWRTSPSILTYASPEADFP